MQKNLPLISVVMNCYNGAKYLRQSIKSVQNQTYQNRELILWDNKSKDNSAEIFKSFKDHRFRYFISDKHTNLHEARNNALEKIKGDYIAFLDTDDWWTYNKLEKQVPFFENKEINLVYGNCWIYKENRFYKKRIYSKKKLPTGYIFNDLIKQHCVSVQTILIRRKSLKSLKIFDSSIDLISDMDFIIRFAYKNKFECVQDPVAYYRIHDENYSKVKAKEQIEQLKKWFEEIKDSKIFSEEKQKTILFNQIQYARIIREILDEKKWKVFKLILLFPNSIRKIKLLVAFLLPNFLIKYIKRFD